MKVSPQFYMPRVMLFPTLAELMIYKYFIIKCIKHVEYYRETDYQFLSTHQVRSVYFAIFALDFFSELTHSARVKASGVALTDSILLSAPEVTITLN